MTEHATPQAFLHALVMRHTGYHEDTLLPDFDAWQAARIAAHESALAACPEMQAEQH